MANKDQIQKKIRVAAWTCGIYLALLIGWFHLEFVLGKLLQFPLALGLVVLFCFILINGIRAIMQSFEFRKEAFRSHLPALLYSTTIAYVFLPFSLSTFAMEGKIVWRACFEGTQNTAVWLFHEGDTFTIRWSGWPGLAQVYRGAYRQQGDTLRLNFFFSKPDRMDSIYICEGEELRPLEPLSKDSTRHVSFYLGYCKGLN